MKMNKLLVLSAAVIMTLGVASCSKKAPATSSATPSSEVAPVASSSAAAASSEAIDVDAVLKDAADYLWQMYRPNNGKAVAGDFTVVKVIYIGTTKVDVSWEVQVVEGVQDAVALKAEGSDDTKQNIYVGLFDFKVTEKTTFKLIPTLTLNGVSKTMTSIISTATVSKEFTRVVNVLEFDTYAKYAEKASSATSEAKAKDTLVKGYVQAISSSGKYVYVADANNTYMVYGSGYDKQTDFKVGDYVAVSGICYAYNGCLEIVKASIVKLAGIEIYAPTYEMPTGYVDATEAFEAASANTDKSLVPYQNRLVEIKNCTLDSIDGNYYYFKTSTGIKFNLYWSTSYFLTAEQNNQWSGAFYIGMNCTVKGRVNCYSNAHQIYPTEVNCIEYTDTDANYAAYVAKNLNVTGMKTFFGANSEVTLPTSDLFGTTIAWSIKEIEVPSQVALASNKLTVTPTAELASATLVATITKGDASVTKEFAFKTQTLTDEQAADKMLEEVSNAQAPGYVDLVAESAVLGGAITYTVKGDTPAGYVLTDNRLVVPNVAADSTATITLTASVKVNDTTKTKDIVITPVHTTTISEFLTAKDKETEVYVRGVVTSFGGTSGEQSFTLADSTGVIFSYNKISMDNFQVGDEIVVKAKFAENYSLPQLGTVANSAVKLASNVALPSVPGKVATTALEAETLIAADDTTDAILLETYAGKEITITEGYVVATSKGYGIASTANGSAKINLYTSVNLKDMLGKKVKVVGYCRGTNKKSGNITIQTSNVVLDEAAAA